MSIKSNDMSQEMKLRRIFSEKVDIQMSELGMGYAWGMLLDIPKIYVYISQRTLDITEKYWDMP